MTLSATLNIVVFCILSCQFSKFCEDWACRLNYKRFITNGRATVVMLDNQKTQTVKFEMSQRKNSRKSPC